MIRACAPRITLLFFIGGCGGTAANDEELAARYERPDGVVDITYPSLPDGRVVTAEADLVIGSEERGDAYILGDVRGVEPAADGTIYIFDKQAAEIRAFDASGVYLRTVAGPGQGPGEIAEANGMALVGDTVLWVHDHRKWRMSGIGTHGGELDGYELPVKSYGYIFSGVIDNDGRYWKSFSQTDAPRTYPPDPGYQENTYEAWLLGYDYRTGRRDSIYQWTSTSSVFIASTGNGWAHYGIPFRGGRTSKVDPHGGFWHAWTSDYRIARLGPSSDTLFVLTVEEAPLPVTEADRDAMLEGVTAEDPERLEAMQQVMSYMPDFKPLISGLQIDDEGRVWVRRVTHADARPEYDVFSAEGEYVGSVRLDFSANEYFPIRVRADRIYALGEDEAGAPVVIRSAPIDFDSGGRTGVAAS